jgi:tetratricopeptide (TPR) repeat protein
LQPAAPYHNLFGIAYAQTGEIDKAAEEFRKANFLDPAQTIYRRNLAKALDIRNSPFREGGRTTDFRGRFEEVPTTDQNIFRFAW